MSLADNIRKMIREFVSIEPMAVLELSDDASRVTLDDGSGAPIIDVPCLASYYPRAAGDQVTVVKLGRAWLVLGAQGKEPVVPLSADDVQDMINASLPDIPDVPPTVTIKWGKSKPSGDGWIQSTDYPYVHDDGSGARTVYLYTGTPPVTPPPESDPPDPTPPPPPPKQPDRRPKKVTIKPNSHGSWRSNGQTSGSILQGNASAWGGSGAWWTGAIFYGNDIASACNGRDVDYMELTLARSSGAGWNRKTPIHLGAHTRSSKGKVTDLSNIYTATKLAWGGKSTFRLSSAIANKLASGSARGVGIQSKGSSDYLGLTSGSGNLVIHFK